MTHAEVARLRLHGHCIAGPKAADSAAIVHHLGAMQAQAYGQALWAIGLRTQGGTAASIEQAISDRKIVRTWPMRGTIHFVPAEDAKWMLRLSAARMLARTRRRHEQLELNNGITQRCEKIFYSALQGGMTLRRSEMMTLLEHAGISTTGQRGYHLLWYAAQTGLICMGPMQNNEQTFVLLDDWVPGAQELSRGDALAELANRYYTAHGPATVHDFAWWAGLTVTDAKAGLEAAKPGLVSEPLNGKEYWRPTTSPGDETRDQRDVYLLPGFDEYLLGYQDRSAVLAAEDADKVVPGRNGVFLPTIVAGGKVVGTWKRELRRGAIEITIRPFVQPVDWDVQVFEAADVYGAFQGRPVSTTIILPGVSRDRPSSRAERSRS